MRFKHGEAVGEIDNLPGCSQIAVFHSAFVPSQFRGNGLGQEAHYDRIGEAQHLLYDYALCTVAQPNSNQLKILEKANWVKLSEFLSTKTGHIVYLMGRNLNV